MRTRVRFKKLSREFNLSAVDIDNASEWLAESLAAGGVDKSDRLRMRLLLEEALINMAGRFGEETRVFANLERRQGRLRLRLVVEGDRYNPLKSDSETIDGDMSTSLFSVIDLHAQYSYSRGANVVRMSIPYKSMNPVLKIAIAILVGAIVGLLGNMLIPYSAQETVSKTVLAPIADAWVRLLQATSGPIIFLTALMATFDTKRISDFGGSRVTVLVRYFAISTVVVVFTLLCAFPVFPLNIAVVEANGSVVAGVLDNILQIIPGNLIEPFISANTPQLLIIAIATGYLLASMGSRIGELKAIVEQLNMLGTTVAQQICALVPFAVGLLLCLKIWTNDTALLGAIWLPLVVAVVISVMVFLVALLSVSVRFRVSPFLLAKKLRGSFRDALKRGTLDFSAVDDLARSCKQLLGVDSRFARASLPTGLFLYMPTSAVGLCVFVLFAAQVQHIGVDQVWLLAAAVLSVVLAVATPPVTGANLLSFVVIFSYLGISNDAILDVMVFDIVFGVLCIAFDQAMLQIETIHQAERMGFLSVEALRAPLEG